jgi:predicted lipoprotein with Yx(FWY)xxD motif
MRSPLLLVVAVLAALALAACGGGSDDSSAPAEPAGTINVAETDLGEILVGADGLTLYLFAADEGGQSSCTGACADNWPPVTIDGSPTAGDDVDSSKLGTASREDGTTQVTYNGHPLYRFSGDEQPGDTNGQEVDDAWYAVTPDGDAAEGQKVGGYGGGY